MILPDHEIRFYCKEQIDNGPLIEPFDEDQLQPASYDVKMDSMIRVPNVIHSHPIDTSKPAEDRTTYYDITGHGYLLTSGRFILGSTREWVNVPDFLVGRIEGKSSRARQGIQIHSAGYLDPGFRGNVTLEIVNFSVDPILIFPDVLIAQLSFEYLNSRCEQPYSAERNHYQNSKGVIASRYGHETKAVEQSTGKNS